MIEQNDARRSVADRQAEGLRMLEPRRQTIPSTAPVKRRDAAATRSRILKAAMEEFAAKGLDGRVEDIAELAGANRRMVYFYFGSKEGLYLAALEATYAELVEVEQRIDVDALGPLEAIAALVSAKFDHYARYPRYIEFLKIENLHKARHLKASERITELRGPLVSILRKVIKRGQASGVIRKNVDPLELYIAICGLGYFAFSNRHTLGAIFNVDTTSNAALAKRKRMTIEMLAAYLSAEPDCAPSDTIALALVAPL